MLEQVCMKNGMLLSIQNKLCCSVDIKPHECCLCMAHPTMLPYASHRTLLRPVLRTSIQPFFPLCAKQNEVLGLS